MGAPMRSQGCVTWIWGAFGGVSLDSRWLEETLEMGVPAFEIPRLSFHHHSFGFVFLDGFCRFKPLFQLCFTQVFLIPNKKCCPGLKVLHKSLSELCEGGEGLEHNVPSALVPQLGPQSPQLPVHRKLGAGDP